jgi:signal transduction histidine kinase/CheY-like chemotaxis protein
MPHIVRATSKPAGENDRDSTVVATVRVERRVHDAARGHAVVATLGQRALAGTDFPLLLEQTVSLVADTLKVAAAVVCEVAEDGRLPVRAAHGLVTATDGHTCLRTDRTRFPASALEAETPVCESPDGPPGCPPEDRDPLLVQEGLSHTVAMRIPGRARPNGLLIIGARHERTYSREDLFFIHAVANVLGAAFERAAMDRDLRRELALYSATVEAAADGILVTNERGLVTRFNQRAIEMWNPPADVIASGSVEAWLAWALTHSLRPDVVTSNYHAALASDGEHAAVIHLKDGRVFERYSRPQRVDGRTVGRVFSFRDITARLKAEEEHRTLERQMLHVQKLESLGVLAGGIAHDFNNLLVSVLGNAGLALAELSPASPVRSRLTDIEIAAQRAAELTRQMLAYAGQGRFVVQRVNLSDLVVELVSLLRTVVARTADIDVRLTNNLPDVEADASQLRQVVMNLVTNAADALGGVPGRIEITTGRMSATREYLSHNCSGQDVEAGEFVFAEIADTGCGMDEKTLARIFDPFFTTKATGRGLGLAAVLGIVGSHCGAIAVESSPGVGTRFRLLLPALGVARSDKTVPGVTLKPPVSSGTILIVDDDAGVRTVATLTLERAGFRVVAACDGEDGVALFRERGSEFDVVLLDMTMPRLSGVETCHLLKKMRPELPIVLTSGYTEPDAGSRFIAGEVAGFLQKPFTPATLVRTIQDAVHGRVQEQA